MLNCFATVPLRTLRLFICLAGMATNLQRYQPGAHPLLVHNRTKAKADPLLALGCEWVESPSELASRCSVVFTMLAKDEALQGTHAYVRMEHSLPLHVHAQLSPGGCGLLPPLVVPSEGSWRALPVHADRQYPQCPGRTN